MEKVDWKAAAFTKLYKLDIPPRQILDKYDEPHRFYHNWEHIESMLQMAHEHGTLTDDLFMAILFHDVIYNPKATDNEYQSAELSYFYLKNEKIKLAILDTIRHKNYTSILSETLCEYDLDLLRNGLDAFIIGDDKIFKEYQFVNYPTYVEKRIEILKSFNVPESFINHVKNRRPKIAVYAGSFNPFHKGHYNILRKAEQIFDKVIIAQGINPAKTDSHVPLPEFLQYRQIEYYSGLLTDFINSLGYDVTLIRGLRNATDLEYELNQYRFLQDLKADIKVVSIFCDKEYEHISSTAIRQLKLYGKEKDYLL